MNRFMRALFCILFVVGCQSIIGLEDHVYIGGSEGGADNTDAGSDGGVDADAGNSEICQDYCDSVLKNCTGKNAVYAEMSTCLGVCKLLPVGDVLEPSEGNTVVCRKRQADLAPTEPNFFCPRAGPGGAGTCGTNCQAYCSLLKSACPDQAQGLTNCEAQCAALRDMNRFDVVADHEGDSIQCRLVHVSTATVQPEMHCPHAQLRPSPPWCILDQAAAPDCNEFCRLEMAVCPGDLATYESLAQCLAVCAALPPGTNGDQDQNTIGCRQYHCYNALTAGAAAHCPHTGPGGDGHCGVDQPPDDTGNCHAYCTLLQGACGTDFAAKFGTQPACQKDCSSRLALLGANANSGYKVSTAQSGNTVACRLLHASRALTDPTECPSALGEGSCK
jgi:hypothetical protein